MDEQQQRLFGLLAAVDDQKNAVNAAIEGLSAERAAIARERAALSQAVISVAGVTGDVKRAAAEAVPALQKAVGEAVAASLTQSLVGASATAARAIGEAAKPILSNLSGMVQAASDAEGSIRNAGQWFAWKWVAVACGGLAGVCLVAYASVAWQLHQVESLNEQKAALAADVAQLQTNVEALKKKGGRIVIDDCGGRLCIQASNNQGKGTENWQGVNWFSDKKIPMVIPRGY